MPETRSHQSRNLFPVPGTIILPDQSGALRHNNQRIGSPSCSCETSKSANPESIIHSSRTAQRTGVSPGIFLAPFPSLPTLLPIPSLPLPIASSAREEAPEALESTSVTKAARASRNSKWSRSSGERSRRMSNGPNSDIKPAQRCSDRMYDASEEPYTRGPITIPASRPYISASAAPATHTRAPLFLSRPALMLTLGRRLFPHFRGP